ncbi:hypothetical protein XELAEV_18023931mg [Xenopus laevis]|uniref:Uncharacterized protein n=1 Tax=Xenopus laevis TaxID=8355 RepID=A0A974HPL1_XENLA|nr:hypothetical protein XELAEV_18023931mg [Xenopus laevis]
MMCYFSIVRNIWCLMDHNDYWQCFYLILTMLKTDYLFSMLFCMGRYNCIPEFLIIHICRAQGYSALRKIVIISPYA